MELKQHRNGRFYIEGPGTEKYMEFIRISYQLFENISFYLTIDTSECFKKIVNNETDVIGRLYPYYDTLDAPYSVPVPIVPTKISFISGYDMITNPIKQVDCSDVLANASLLEPQVQINGFFLVLSMILFIITTTLVYLNHSQKVSKMRKIYSKRTFRFVDFIKIVLRQINLVYYGKSRKFKWISFLFYILCFYIITSFMILYKTSKIIYQEPFYAKNYEEIIKDTHSLPIFYDPISDVYEKFVKSPKESLRGKILTKLNNFIQLNNKTINETIKNNYIVKGQFSVTGILKKQQEITVQVTEKHDVLFANYFSLYFIRNIMCSLTKNEQLFRPFVFSDDSENEELLGYPVIKGLDEYFASKYKRIFYSYINIKFLTTFEGLDEITNYDTTKEHRRVQNLVCSQSYSLNRQIPVHAISFTYYAKFICFSSVTLTIAFIVNAIEILIGSKKKKKFMSNRLQRRHVFNLKL